MSCAEAWQLAKKADVLSAIGPRTPIPPHVSGSDAWDHAVESSLTFRMFSCRSLMSLSREDTSGERKAGEECSRN